MISVGDVVQLKSGSPKLSVSRIKGWRNKKAVLDYYHVGESAYISDNGTTRTSNYGYFSNRTISVNALEKIN